MLVFPVFLSAQVLQDSLENSLLAEFSTDPEHHQFHREQGPLDSLFRSYVPAVDPDLVEDRVSCLDLEIPLVVNKTVCSFIHYFTVRRRNYTQTMLERKNYYFPIFEYYLQKYEMPDALKYLAIVESGLNYKAKSKAGALGLWQFMPGTGRDFRLDQSHHSDQRQNPLLATEAACKFLKSLYGTFQDWELALAAYNCGPGNVLKAQRRSGKKGFWEIYSFLPQETRSYVPQFHAVVYAMNFAREHNIIPDIDSVLTVIPLDTFRINRTCDLRKLETMLGMDPKALQQHNPDLRSNFFPGGTLLVPGSHGSLLAANLEIYLDSARCIAPVRQVAKLRQEGVFIRKGTSVAQFTSRRGWDKMAFCKLNGIKGDKIRRSRHYQIPEKSQTTESLASSDSSSEKSQKFSGKSLQGNKEKLIVKEASAERQMSKKSEAISLPEFHMVVKGDGLFSIARKYGLEVGKLRSLNPGTGDKLWNGQQIRLRDDAFADSDSANGKKEAGVIHPVASSAVSAQSIKQTTNEGTPILYEVQKGDTLYSITRKFNRLSVKELIRINNLKNRQIKPGQQLIVG